MPLAYEKDIPCSLRLLVRVPLAAPGPADDYVWTTKTATASGIDPVNWDETNNSAYNVAPTASDGAIFRKNFSPAGTVKLTGDGFAQRIRQEFSRDYRTIYH